MKLRKVLIFFLIVAVSISQVNEVGSETKKHEFVSDGSDINLSKKNGFNGIPYSIVLLPDTQFYTYQKVAEGEKLGEIFDAQTQWILDHETDLNIAFVAHLGDITEQSETSEWNRAKSSMSLLDNVVPYVTVIGNHDYYYIRGSMSRISNLYNQTFPISAYLKQPWFGGVFEPGKMDNSYHFFSAGDTHYIVLCLEFGPRNSVLEWAGKVIADHPEKTVIVVTHSYLNHDNILLTDDVLWASLPFLDFEGKTTDDYNTGQQMWEKLISVYKNIKFVFSGHVGPDGVGRLVSTGRHGNKVYQIVSNYQHLENGGNSYLRQMEFSPDGKMVSVKTYSPFLDQYLNDDQNRFDIDLENGKFLKVK
jgi:hypothetical protein